MIKIISINKIEIKGLKSIIVKLMSYLNNVFSYFTEKVAFNVISQDAFLKQFDGIFVTDNLDNLELKYDAISGATKSSSLIKEEVFEFLKTARKNNGFSDIKPSKKILLRKK